MRSRVDIKAEAKELVRTGRVSPILVTAIMLVITGVLGEVVSLMQYGTLSAVHLRDTMEQILRYGEVYLTEEPAISLPVRTFASVLVSLAATVIHAGYYSYCMGIRRREETPISTLADGLGIVGKVIWCSILVGIKVFLWSLLFYFPGFIAAYRYRFAMINIISDPSLSASQAIALSCEQTNGMKLDLFVLDLSFIGWRLLSSLTFGILDIWLTPYITLSELGYYEMALPRVGAAPGDENEPKNDTPWEF